jgi:hypothetical protein
MNDLANKIMQYFHDRLIANGIDPAEIKGKVSIETRDMLLFTQIMQYSFFDQGRTRGPGESYIRLEVGSLHPTKVETKGIPGLSTIISTMLAKGEMRATGEAKKVTISIAAQELRSDAYKSGGEVVLNAKGKIAEIKDIPSNGLLIRDDDRHVILQKGMNYQRAINTLVDHFSEHYMPAPRHRTAWKNKAYK